MKVSARPALRIAQIAPLPIDAASRDVNEVVTALTGELVSRGHQVTLFAAGDPHIGARYVPPAPAAGLDATDWQPGVYESLVIDAVMERRGEFDLIHNHLGFAFYPFARTCLAPVISTVHGPLDGAGMQTLHEHFDNMLFVSTSHAQRGAVPNAHFVATVYEGVPEARVQSQPRGDYLACFGAIREGSGVADAVRVALGAKMPIRIGVPPDSVDEDYFETWVDPLFEHPLVQWDGEMDGPRRDEFLGSALASVFMADAPQHSGLPLIESMASGTPVIARRGGASDEVVDEGVTGYLVEDIEEAVASARKLFDEAEQGGAGGALRARFRERFSATCMTSAYERLYRLVVAGRAGSVQPQLHGRTITAKDSP